MDHEKTYNQTLDLLNRSLAENKFSPIVAFIEQQVASDIPQIALLHEFSEGLEQRLMFLRVHYFDVRQSVIKTFSEQYGVDIIGLVPVQESARYHQIVPEQIITHVQNRQASFSEADLAVLHDLLSESTQTAAQLYSEMESLTALQTFLLDWLAALSADTSRRFWPKFEPTLGQWTELQQMVQ